MRLAFLSSSTGWGGLERNLLRYARWMAELGHNVEVHSVGGSPLNQRAQSSSFRARTFQRQHRHFPGKAAVELRRHLQSNEVAVLWIRDPRDLPLCSQAVRGTSTRLLFHQGMQIPQPKRRIWHRRRFSQVTSWVAPLEHLKTQALTHTPLQPDQVDVIPLALEDEWFERPKTPEAKQLWALPEDAKIVGLFGRIDPLKGHTTLFQALHAMQDERWHALIVGENTPNAGRDFRSELLKLATSLGIDHRIHWRSPSEDLLAAYDACDAYAMCSHAETIGMVTIEAMARKLPVIGTQAGGTPELLGNGQHGRLVKPEDPQALAHALDTVESCPIASDEHLAQFRKERVLERWSARLAALRVSAS